MIKDYTYFKHETQLSVEDHNKLKRVALTLLVGSGIIFGSIVGLIVIL